MSETTETVKIVNPDKPDEYLIIDKADYNAEEDTLWEEKDAGKPKKPSSRQKSGRDADKDKDKESLKGPGAPGAHGGQSSHPSTIERSASGEG